MSPVPRQRPDPAVRLVRKPEPIHTGDTAPAAPAEPGAEHPPARPRRTAAGRTDAGKGIPAEPVPPPAAPEIPYSERLSITTTIGQIQALRVARAADGIQATARLRAMIALWQEDPDLRERIDRAARDWR